MMITFYFYQCTTAVIATLIYVYDYDDYCYLSLV